MSYNYAEGILRKYAVNYLSNQEINKNQKKIQYWIQTLDLNFIILYFAAIFESNSS